MSTATSLKRASVKKARRGPAGGLAALYFPDSRPCAIGESAIFWTTRAVGGEWLAGSLVGFIWVCFQ